MIPLLPRSLHFSSHAVAEKRRLEILQDPNNRDVNVTKMTATVWRVEWKERGEMKKVKK